MSSASEGLRPSDLQAILCWPPDHHMLAQTCSHARHVV